MRGFKKNAPKGSPYLPSMADRDLLFPAAPDSSVYVAPHQVSTSNVPIPTVQIDPQEQVADTLRGMSLNLE